MLNLTSMSEFEKIVYPDGPETIWYPDDQFFAAIPKSTDFVGESERVVFEHTGVPAANDFSVAAARTDETNAKKFTIDTLATLYAFGKIDNQTLLRCKGNKGAIMDAVDRSYRQSLYGFSRATIAQVWGNGGAALGQIASTSGVTTGTVTLSNVDDMVNFEVGMYVVASAADGTSGALRAGKIKITAIDRQAKTLTAATHWDDTITGVAASDYLFAEGCWGGSSNVIKGVFAYIPVTAPTAGVDSFWGCDRGTDVERLSGQRVSGGGAPLEETVFDAVAQAMQYGGHPDVLVINNRREAELRKTMHSKSWVQVETKTTNPMVSFRNMGISGPRSDITIMTSSGIPYARGLLTKLDSWKFKSAGPWPHFENVEGSELVREPGADGVGYRRKGYGQLINYKPSDSVLITW